MAGLRLVDAACGSFGLSHSWERHSMLDAARPLRVVVILLALALLACVRGPVALAAVGPLRMQVSVGFGGYYRPSSFVPIHVQVSNGGSEVVATLRVDDIVQQFSTVAPYNHASYTRTVVLPDGSVKNVVLYVPGADLGPAISVSLIVQAHVVAQQAVNVNQVSSATESIGVMSRTPAVYVQLKSFGGSLGGVQLRVVPLGADSLEPQPFAMTSLDAIVIENFDTMSLSPDQLSALTVWVRLGGVLVTIGGPTAQAAVLGLPASLRLGGTGAPLILSAIPSLSAFSREALPSTRIVAAIADAANAHVLLDDQAPTVLSPSASNRGRPIVVERTLGLGSVVYSAVDPTLAPLALWQGVQNFWTMLTSTVRAGDASLSTSFAQSNLTNTTSTLNGEVSSIAPPSMTLFIVLLGVYILGLLPVNFLVLYRLKRRDLSWLTLPALAAVLVVSVFAGSYYGRGRDLRANLISVEYQVPGTDAAVGQMYAGLIAPTAGSYSLTVGDQAALAAPLYYNAQDGVPSDVGDTSSQVIVSEDNAQATLPNISSWSSRSVSFALTYPSRAAPLSSKLALSSNGAIVGEVRNSGASTIYSVLLQAFDGSTQDIGDLQPGASRAVSLPMGAGNQGQGDIASAYGDVGTGGGPILGRRTAHSPDSRRDHRGAFPTSFRSRTGNDELCRVR